MNPISWLEQHPNAAVATIVAGSILLVVFAAWVIHWYVVDARYWLTWLHRERRGDLMFDDDWQRLDPDAAADQLTAEWHADLPGPDPLRATWPANNAPRETAGSLRAGELHLEPWLERAWWDDPDLVVWDAKQQAARCWEILHIEFPRLRAELGIAA